MALKRTASSPVIAEMMLLCIAIIVSIPLGSYVFGLMGSNNVKVEVVVSSSSCSAVDSRTTACDFMLTNVGSKDGQFQPYAIIMLLHGNQTTENSSDACAGEGGNAIKAGSTLKVDCQFDLIPGNASDQYSGWLSVSGAGWIPFAGRF